MYEIKVRLSNDLEDTLEGGVFVLDPRLANPSLTTRSLRICTGRFQITFPRYTRREKGAAPLSTITAPKSQGTGSG